jgi:pimeloyl-ACP methyl ester carboxylesterase
VFTTVTLRDGRTMEYADLGDPEGTAVLFCHGTPATGGQALVLADTARAHGVRLLAPSRSGYGDSTSSSPGLAPAAADMLELADKVGLERFAVIGSSGGGPFALALAATSPDRVRGVAVHGGPGVYAEVQPEVIEDDDRRALALARDGDVDEAMRIMTGLGDAFLGGMRGLAPAEFSAALQKMAPPGENYFERHPDLRGAFESDFQRAITTSDGFALDNLSWLGPWDIDLTSITAPVRLVYGESDRMAQPAHGTWLHERLPTSELQVIPGGHGDVTFGAVADSFAVLSEA